MAKTHTPNLNTLCKMLRQHMPNAINPRQGPDLTNEEQAQIEACEKRIKARDLVFQKRYQQLQTKQNKQWEAQEARHEREQEALDKDKELDKIRSGAERKKAKIIEKAEERVMGKRRQLQDLINKLQVYGVTEALLKEAKKELGL